MPSMPSIAEQSAVMARGRDQPPPRPVPASAIDDAVRQATSLADLARLLAELSARQ